MLFWISTFDIGLGNGMRNYLTKAISEKNLALGRKYISTTLSLLSLIAITIGFLLLIPLFTINFNKFFNTFAISNVDLRNALFVALAFTLLNFVTKNIGLIFVAMQKYAINIANHAHTDTDAPAPALTFRQNHGTLKKKHGRKMPDAEML